MEITPGSREAVRVLVRSVSGICLGSCPGSHLVCVRVRIWFASGFVSGSCTVRVRFVSGSCPVRFVFGFVFGFASGSRLGSCLVRDRFVAGSYLIRVLIVYIRKIIY